MKLISTRRKPKRTVDGDTFELHQALKGKKFVRLAGIDTPEKGQFGYEKAKRQLAGMIGGKRITIKPQAIKRRIIAEVYADNMSVNKRMRERGWA